MSKPTKVRVQAKVDLYGIVNDVIWAAVEWGMNKHDKYVEGELSPQSRQLLHQHIENYFWIELEERGVELVGRRG